MKIKSIVFLAFLIISVFTGCGDKKQIPEDIAVSQKVQVQPEPIFNLITSNGTSLKIKASQKGWSFEGLEGKVILLDFFGTWCPPCKAEIPHLNNIRNKISDKFEIIGIDIGPRGGGITPKNELKSFIEKFEIKYPVTSSEDNNHLYGALRELNPNGSIPFMVLLNAKGQYLTHYIGMVPEEMIQSDINKALAQ